MNNQTVLITGGTGKLGRRFVKHFIDKDWNVLFTTTTKKKKNQLEKYIGSNKKLKGYVVNFSKKNSCEALIKKIHKDKFFINHLINAARSRKYLKINRKDGMSTRDNFSNEYILDVFVPYKLSIEIFNKQKSKLRTITNIGSQYGVVAATPKLYLNYIYEYPIQYGVAKAALIHLTKELAVRFAKNNIRVNCLVLGGIEGRVDNNFKKRYAKLTPMGKMLNEEDVLGPLDFILKETSKAINGQTIIADGGWTLW
jgi:NAD(P)-dependent dehydrogenase (short-subunit alcohol dehydrogenase family)